MSAGPVMLLSPSPHIAAETHAKPAAPAATGRDRLALLDTVRLAAAAGIVWVHAAQSDLGQLIWPVGMFGVPFYTFVAVLFMTRTLTKPNGKTLREYAGGRLGRVYLPFLFWSAVYLAMGEAKSILGHDGLFLPDPTILYAGGHEHLWFLPYLLVVTLFGATLVRGLKIIPGLRWPVVAALLFAGAYFAALNQPQWIDRRGFDVDFWRLSFRALPTVCWSIALALATAFDGKMPRASGRVALMGVLLVLGVMATQAWIDQQKILRTFAGLGCLAIALYPLANTAIARLGSLGRFTYGIYLSHLLFIRFIDDILLRHAKPTLLTDVAVFGVSFAGAITLSILLSKSKYTRWTLGE
ncbi:MAG: acyltransferase [Tepidisphaeraceae bacterium]